MDMEQNFVTSSARSLLWRLDAVITGCLSSRSVDSGSVNLLNGGSNSDLYKRL